MATPNIVPRADSEGGLGTASKYWASAYIDLIYVGAGKVGRDADNLIDFSTDNNITFRINNNNELTLDSGQLYPVTNNGLALGAAGYGFSDLYLANGAVIKFDNGNVTLTHSSNTLTLADSDVLALGTSSDLQLFHESGNSFIQNFIGDLTIRNFNDDADIIFQSDDGSGGIETYFFLDGDNGVVNFPDDKRLTFGTDRDLFLYHQGLEGILKNYTGQLTFSQEANDGDMVFKSDDGSGGTTEYFRVDGGITKTVFVRDTKHEDSKKALFGDQDDLQIYHDSNHSYIAQSGTGDLYIQQSVDDRDIYFQSDNGAGGVANYFYLDGSSALHDGSATTALYTNWPDNSYISLGGSHDLQLVHTGVNSVIQSLVGKLQITSHSDDIEFIQFGNDKDINFSSDDGSGGTTTYFKLDGGLGYTVAKKQFLLDDNVQLSVGTSEHGINMIHDGSNSTMSNAIGNLTIINYQNDGDIIFKSDNGTGSEAEYFRLDGSDVKTIFSKPIEVGVDDTGHDVKFFGATSGASWKYGGTGGDGVLLTHPTGTTGLEIYTISGGLATVPQLKIGRSTEQYWGVQCVDLDANIIHRQDETSEAMRTNFQQWDSNTSDTTGSWNFQHGNGSGGSLVNAVTITQAGNITAQGTITATSYKAGSATILQGDADVILGSSGGTGTISLTTHSSVPFKIENDDSISMSPAKIVMTNLPTSDPTNAGQLWNDSGTLKISAG